MGGEGGERTRTLYCIKHLRFVHKGGGGGGGSSRQFNSRSDISFGKGLSKVYTGGRGGGGGDKVKKKQAKTNKAKNTRTRARAHTHTHTHTQSKTLDQFSVLC